MDGADVRVPVLSGVYVEPRSNGLHVTCGTCRGMMRAEEGTTFDDEERGVWLWWRCILNPLHITRAMPLPVQMARSC